MLIFRDSILEGLDKTFRILTVLSIHSRTSPSPPEKKDTRAPLTQVIDSKARVGPNIPPIPPHPLFSLKSSTLHGLRVFVVIRRARDPTNMATQTETIPSVTKLQLRTAYGPVYRDVLPTAPREARADEIPVIDISGIYGDLEDRKALAKQIKHAAENTGFFYIKNHAIPNAATENALNAAKAFFAQPLDKKLLVSKSLGKYFNGFSGNGTALVSPTEGGEYSMRRTSDELLNYRSRLPRRIQLAI